MPDRCASSTWAGVILAATFASAPAMVPAQATGAQPAGIWKAAVPPRPMRGEFDNLDPIGVAAGARILADCSLNWINPDDGRRYCFSSGTSLEIFLYQPQVNIELAQRGWEKLQAQRP